MINEERREKGGRKVSRITPARELGLQKHLIISHQFFSPSLVYCLNVTQIYSLSDARVSNPIQLWEHSFRNGGEVGMSATSILLNVIFHSLMNHHMREKFKIASCEGELAFG